MIQYLDCNLKGRIFAIVNSIQVLLWTISNAKIQNKYGKDSKKTENFN